MKSLSATCGCSAIDQILHDVVADMRRTKSGNSFSTKCDYDYKNPTFLFVANYTPLHERAYSPCIKSVGSSFEMQIQVCLPLLREASSSTSSWGTAADRRDAAAEEHGMYKATRTPTRTRHAIIQDLISAPTTDRDCDLSHSGV